MAWVRIHDGAMGHPKIVGMFDWRDPFHLWVWGLSYCQSHLTDGRIIAAAVPRSARKAAAELVARQLWEVIEGGWKVHDYLTWNDARATVDARRSKAADRLRRWHEKQNAVQNAVANEKATLAKPNLTKPNLTKERTEEPTARSKRPIFTGQRFTVFEWQLDDLRRMLGSHTEGFDLHAWFFDLDAQAVKSAFVIPVRDGGKWLQAQTLAEAKRRGLRIADDKPPKPTEAEEVAAILAEVKRQDEAVRR